MNLSDIVHRHFDSVAAFVRRRSGGGLRSRENVSDIVQSTFRELVHAQGRLGDRGEESLRLWLRAAAECKIRNRARHWGAARRDMGRDLRLPVGGDGSTNSIAWQPESLVPSPVTDACLHETEERLLRAFSRLPEEFQAVIRLAKVEGCSHSEIAKRMRRTEVASRKLLSRALARLALEMGVEDGEQEGRDLSPRELEPGERRSRG
jgi:RNA polymerase sigma factor (sigma-70 family)